MVGVWLKQGLAHLIHLKSIVISVVIRVVTRVALRLGNLTL